MKDWIKDMDVFLDLLTTNFVQNDEMKAFVEACKLFPKITEFLNIVKIEDKEDYMKKLEEYKKNVKKFYEQGKVSFFTGDVTGDGSAGPGDKDN